VDLLENGIEKVHKGETGMEFEYLVEARKVPLES